MTRYHNHTTRHIAHQSTAKPAIWASRFCKSGGSLSIIAGVSPAAINFSDQESNSNGDSADYYGVQHEFEHARLPTIPDCAANYIRNQGLVQAHSGVVARSVRSSFQRICSDQPTQTIPAGRYPSARRGRASVSK